MSDSGTYAYLVTRSLVAEDLGELQGVGGSDVRLVRSDGLVAVVSTVELAEFGEDALKRNLEDLDWLERVARDHDHVINRVNDVTTVAPLRMATIFYDDDRVTELLREWSPALRTTLDRVDGCSEWSVKLFQPTATRAAADRAGTDQDESGTAYLQRRRSETQQRAQAAEAAADLADVVYRTLSDGTVASRRLPPQDRRLTGHLDEMTLNGAFLVQDERGTEFDQLVRDTSDRYPQARLELNGPWPPYSFALLETGSQS